MRSRLILSTLALVLALPLLGGCLFGKPTKPTGGNTEVVYEDYTTRDHLIQNFIKAWEAQDEEEYQDNILYDGDETTGLPAPDGVFYETFLFYYAEGTIDINGDPLYEQSYEEEVSNVTRLFSGNPGQNADGEVPGVASIDLILLPVQAWNDPPGDLVEGHPYPEGTKRVKFESDMTILLKGSFGPDDTTGFDVDDELEFHVIPVLVNAGTADERVEYRIWKWQDLFVDTTGGGI